MLCESFFPYTNMNDNHSSFHITQLLALLSLQNCINVINGPGMNVMKAKELNKNLTSLIIIKYQCHFPKFLSLLHISIFCIGGIPKM